MQDGRCRERHIKRERQSKQHCIMLGKWQSVWGWDLSVNLDRSFYHVQPIIYSGYCSHQVKLQMNNIQSQADDTLTTKFNKHINASDNDLCS